MHARIETDRQEGDIAGTKLKKFHYALEHEIAKEFELIKHYFVYSGARHADVYLLVRPKKEIVVRGPPVALKNTCLRSKRCTRKYLRKMGDGMLVQCLSVPAVRFARLLRKMIWSNRWELQD